MEGRREADVVLRELTECVQEVAQGVGDLADKVGDETASRRRNRVWMAITCVIVGTLILLQGLSAWEARRAREQLFDCSVKGGECFERTQNRTNARLEASITEIVCADAEDTRTILGVVLAEVFPENTPTVPPMPEQCR